MNRANEPGWIRIGRDIRRSLWVRVVERSEPAWSAALSREEQIEAIELCAGREGDDSFARIDRSSPTWAALNDIVQTALYGVDVDDAGRRP